MRGPAPSSQPVAGRIERSYKRAGLPGELKAPGPAARMLPTALPVQSDALTAGVHGPACRLARTCSRFPLVPVTAGPHPGLVAAAASTAVRAEPPGQHRQGRLPTAGATPGAWSSTAS